MIKILYFSSIREALGCSEEELPVEDNGDLDKLKNTLISRGDDWRETFTERNYHTAVNQEIVRTNTKINDGDEIAFFPEVTGG